MLGGVISLTLAGCFAKTTLQDDFEDYRDRLSKILDVPPPDVHSPTLALIAYLPNLGPQQEDTLVIKLREFYGLPGCELKALIAERNSVLGKVQAPSLQFVYDQKILNAIEACIPVSSEEQRETLAQFKTIKLTQLPHSFEKVLVNSEEIKAAFRASSKVLSDPIEQYQHSILGFQLLATLKKDLRNDNSATLEQALKTINEQRFPAKLLNTVALKKAELTAISLWLDEHIFMLSCRKSKDKQKAEYLNNVIKLKFIEVIQVKASAINKLYYQFIPLLESIYPEQRLEYVRVINEEFQAMQDAMRAHVKVLSKVRKKCS